MDKHRKKMVAPIVITVLVIAYYVFLFGALIKETEGIVPKLLLGLLPALLGITMVGVCVQRIKEIKGGEEDDLSKY